jgi:hypothetical protein
MMGARNTIQKTSENLKKANDTSRAVDYENQELTSRPHRKNQQWLSHRSDRHPKTYVKPEAAITVFELLMMGGVSPKTS